MGTLEQAQVAAAEHGLVVEGDAHERGETPERQRAGLVLEERRLVGADLGSTAGAEMPRPRRDPGVHVVRSLRNVRRVPHAVDVRVPAKVRRLRLGLRIEDRGERALRRIVGSHGVTHDLA